MANQITSFESWNEDDVPVPDVEDVELPDDDDYPGTLAERMRLGRMTEADDRARVQGRLGEDD